jgi:protein phosphatase
LRQQYASAGRSGMHALAAAKQALEQAREGIEDMESLLSHTDARLDALTRYRDAYRNYCWPVSSVTDLKLAPFHLLASEGKVHTDKQHTWHMENLGRLSSGDPQLLIATPFRQVDLNDPASCEDATAWWAGMTSAGNEGIVVKPLNYISKGRRGYVQPAIKCRGPEYLRIIYGPEYLLPENLERLRSRGVGAKRSLASREFALGIEALERFVRKEPLRRTHECVFGVLALESEPVDPRL